jgi:hypothetical protein
MVMLSTLNRKDIGSNPFGSTKWAFSSMVEQLAVNQHMSVQFAQGPPNIQLPRSFNG